MSRTLAREIAFQALFQLDFNGGDVDTRDQYEELAIETCLTEGRKISEDNQNYVRKVVKGTRANLDAIDVIIAAHLKKGWTIGRLMSVDRNLLRLAVFELKFDPSEKRVPIGVVINEAVELAKRYGTDDSSRFINAVLDAVSKATDAWGFSIRLS